MFSSPFREATSILPIWSALTCSFIEPAIVRLLISLTIICYTLRSLEQVWPLKELLGFLFFSVGVSGILLLFIGKIIALFFTPYPVAGCTSLIIAILVGYRHIYPYREILNLKNLVPDSVLKYLPCGGVVQARHLPFSIISIELLLWVFWPALFPDVFLAAFTLLTSWVFIRYSMFFPYANERGDHSSDFVLSALFPKRIRPHIDQAAAVVYARLGSVIELRDKVTSTGLYSPNVTALSAADPNETQKRMAAFMVLEETIAKGLTKEEIAEV